MNVFDPATWIDFDSHPIIRELGDNSWRQNYKGDVGDSPDAALVVVRNAVLKIRAILPSASTELIVLDSLAWFVELKADNLEGEVFFCDGQTLGLRLDMDDREPLYEDDVPLESVDELIGKHFDL